MHRKRAHRNVVVGPSLDQSSPDLRRTPWRRLCLDVLMRVVHSYRSDFEFPRSWTGLAFGSGAIDSLMGPQRVLYQVDLEPTPELERRRRVVVLLRDELIWLCPQIPRSPEIKIFFPLRREWQAEFRSL